MNMLLGMWRRLMGSSAFLDDALGHQWSRIAVKGRNEFRVVGADAWKAYEPTDH